MDSQHLGLKVCEKLGDLRGRSCTLQKPDWWLVASGGSSPLTKRLVLEGPAVRER